MFLPWQEVWRYTTLDRGLGYNIIHFSGSTILSIHYDDLWQHHGAAACSLLSAIHLGGKLNISRGGQSSLVPENLCFPRNPRYLTHWLACVTRPPLFANRAEDGRRSCCYFKWNQSSRNKEVGSACGQYGQYPLQEHLVPARLRFSVSLLLPSPVCTPALSLSKIN